MWDLAVCVGVYWPLNSRICQIYDNFFRQTLAEFNPAIKIYLVRLDGVVKITNLSRQLPDAFTPKKLALKFYNGESNGECNGEVNGKA